MVVRCSLLGHDFGATEIERQREERGSEVVVTVEEYEECSRCGARNVLSENTEVKSLAPEPSDEDAERAVEPDAAAPAEAAEPVDDEPNVPTDEDGEPITDDAEILDDSGDGGGRERERERGEWPSSEDVGAPAGEAGEPRAWPEDEGEDDAVEGSDPLAAHADVDGGPEEPAGGEPAERDPGSGIESAGEAPSPGEGAPRDDVPTEFFCPRCDFVAAGDRGSLRAGDICPDCKRGYLGERERRV